MNNRNQEKILIIDLDGTITPTSTWEAFNTALGITAEQDQALFTQYKNGTLSYTAWIEQLVLHYKQSGIVATKQDIETLASTVAMFPDATTVVQTAKEKGYTTILVSGSVDTIVATIAKRVGVDLWLACSKACYENDVLTGIESTGDEARAKITLLTNAGIHLSKEVISIGDGGNDELIFKETKGILIGTNKILLPLAYAQVTTLTEALNYL